MTRTLLKHEAIRTRGFLLAIGAAGVALVAVGGLLALTGWPVLGELGAVVAFAGAIGVLPAIQVAQGIDYWRSGYGRIGYFTQTLPVRGARIYGAKLAWAAVVLVAGLLLTAALALLAALASARTFGSDPALLLAQVGDAIAAASAAAPWLVVAAVPVTVLLYGLTTVLHFCAASVGSEQPLQRLSWGGPVLLWFVLHVVVQIAMFVLILAIPLGIGATASGEIGIVHVDLLGALLAGTEPELVPIGFVAAIAVVLPLLVWRTARSWDRKVSLA